MFPPFASGVLKILRGSIIAQVIGVLALPVLSRLFEPEVFGTVQGMMSLLVLFLITSSLRLEIAILSVPDLELFDLFHSAFWLCVVTSSLFFIGLLLLLPWENNWELFKGNAILYLPFITLFAGWNQLLNYLALRRKKFDASSNSKVAQSVAYASLAIGAGIISPSIAGLALAEAAGRVGSNIYLQKSLRILTLDIIIPPRLSLLKTQLYKHKNLVTVGLASAIVNAAGSAFTIIMLLWIFTASDAGQYAMVERFIGIPIGLIVGAASQVFISHLSELIANKDEKSASRVFRRLVRMQSKLAIVPAVLLFVLSPIVIPVLLGEGWDKAGQFAQALALLYYFVFISGPVNMALTVIGKLELQFVWDAGRLLFVAFMWLMVWLLELTALQAVWMYVVVSCSSYFIYIVITDHALLNIE